MELVAVGVPGKVMIEEPVAQGHLVAGLGQVRENPGLGVPRTAGLPAVGGRGREVHASVKLLRGEGPQAPVVGTQLVSARGRPLTVSM